MKSINPKANLRRQPQGYTTTDIMKLGIKRERLKDWMERNFIEPSIQKASGQGTKNIFSIYDLYKIKLFKLLVETGLPRKQASVEFKIKWLTELIKGHEDSFWRNTPFLVSIKISDEQDPIINSLFHSGRKSAEALAQSVKNMPKSEHDLIFGSFVLLPIVYQDDERAIYKLGICGSDFISINREIAEGADSLTVINVEKIVAEVDKIVS